MQRETRALTREFTLRIIMHLQHGPARFNELGRLSGAPHPPLLSRHLKKMQRDDLIARHVHQLGPPAVVSYQLTDLGRSMLPPATAMVSWIDEHRDELVATRQISMLRAKAGEFLGQPLE